VCIEVAAAEPLSAVDTERKAPPKEQEDIVAKLAALRQRKRDDASNAEAEPSSDTLDVQSPSAEMATAERAAEPFVRRFADHDKQIAGLLPAPRPGGRILGLLGPGVHQSWGASGMLADEQKAEADNLGPAHAEMTVAL